MWHLGCRRHRRLTGAWRLLWRGGLLVRRGHLLLPLALHGIRPRPKLLHVTQNLGTPRGSLIPRVITCHDMIRLVMHEQYIQGSRAYLEAYRFAELTRFALARRVIAVSQFTADDLLGEIFGRFCIGK